jgi:hypothetical protein
MIYGKRHSGIYESLQNSHNPILKKDRELGIKPRSVLYIPAVFVVQEREISIC